MIAERPEGVKYLKTAARATMKGESFEYKMSGLLYLRAIRSGRAFQIATNVEGAGAFDDIVFRFKSAENPTVWNTCFLQLKHKQSSDFTLNMKMFKYPKGKFALKAYLKTFEDIKKSMVKENASAMFDGPFESSTFVIYTNATFDKESRKLRREIRSQVDEYLKTDSYTNREDVFSFTEESDGDVIASLEAEENIAKDFLRRLRLFTAQPSEDQLVEVIKDELRKTKGVKDNIEINSFYRIFDEKIKHWWEHSGTALDESSDILTEVVNQAEREGRIQEMDNTVAFQKRKFRMDVQFQDSSFSSLQKACIDNKSVLNIVVEGDSRLTTTKLLQMLESSCSTDFIFLGERCLMRKQEAVLSVWRQSKYKNLLVIVSEDKKDDVNEEDICTKLLNVLQEDKTKRIVMVSSGRNWLATKLKELLQRNINTIEDSFNLSQLTLDSIRSMFEKTVILQGHETTLGELLGNDIDEASKSLDTNVCAIIICSNSIRVGSELQSEIGYYIPRSMICRQVIKSSIFSDKSSLGKILIRNATLDNIQVYLQFTEEQSLIGHFQEGDEGLEFQFGAVAHDSGFESFGSADGRTVNGESLRASMHDTNYLEFDEKKLLVWKKTCGDISFIKKHVDEDQHHKIHDLQDRVVLLIAEPGMGKSTHLTHIAHETKRDHPDTWVVFIALNNHVALMAKWKDQGLNADEFLKSVVGFDKMSPVEKSLFIHCLKRTGNISVIADGFDEIVPRYETNCIAFLSSLLKTKVKKIWVSSRRSIGDALEKHFSTLGVTLEKFNHEDQRIFLLKYWKIHTGCSHKVLNLFITKLLLIKAKSLNRKEEELTGIPLQTRMLAEIYQEFVVCEKKILPEKLHVLELIEQFADKIHNTSFRKAFRITESSPLYETVLEDQRLSFIEKHCVAALVLLFQSDLVVPNIRSVAFDPTLTIVDRLTINNDFVNRFFDDVTKGIDKTGLIEKIVDDKPTFLHHVYAEYFAALWFSRNYTKNRDFMRKRLLGNTFDAIRGMFDRLLARDNPLHLAVINMDAPRTYTLLTEGADVNARDKGGRTPLHLAVVAGLTNDMSYKKSQLTIMELLLTNKASSDIKDDVLQWTPLQYADAASLWPEMETLLEHGIGRDNKLCQKTREQIGIQSVLEAVLKHDYDNIFSLMLKLGLPLDYMYFSQTLLHLSALHGSSKIAKLLITLAMDTMVTDTHPEGTSTGTKSSPANVMASLMTLLDARDALGDNPLMTACYNNKILVVRMLLATFSDDGAKAEYVNKRASFDRTALSLACLKGNESIVDVLITSGADLNLQDQDGRTGLMLALERGRVSVVEALLQQNHRTEYVNTPDNKGQTALLLATRKGFHVVAEKLAESGADVTLSDEEGKTVLMLACKRGMTKLVSMVIASFKDEGRRQKYINLRDKNGRYALLLATVGGHKRIQELLLRNGAKQLTSRPIEPK